MNAEWLQLIPCPSCGRDLHLALETGTAHCGACGGSFVLDGHLCPVCYTHHQETGVICDNCGSALTRVCPACQTRGWSGQGLCLSCGGSLDIVDLITRYQGDATVERLNAQMPQARVLKELEEVGSSKRMQELMAIEEMRQLELGRRLAKQQAEERRLLLLVGAAIALFVLALVIYAALGG